MVLRDHVIWHIVSDQVVRDNVYSARRSDRFVKKKPQAARDLTDASYFCYRSSSYDASVRDHVRTTQGNTDQGRTTQGDRDHVYTA